MHCLLHAACVGILSVPYSLEKNIDSGGGVTDFKDQSTDMYMICACYKSTIGLIRRLVI